MDRKQHWEDVYSRRSPEEVSWYQDRPDLSLKLMGEADISLDTPILDAGGGASNLVDHLLDGGYTDVTVLDLSATALEHARRRLGERAARVSWIEGDVTAFRPERAYGLWHDRAVFHFLTDPSDRAAYGEVLHRALPVGGRAVIATFGPDGPEKCSGLPVVRYSP
ncbi:MAG TPA: class I SAM-dependent methyltransferase, partial [Gammaproteobacteria bacterium]|nr:class I SAM-dependent methyltransferase [Gammaproteobacteria bacterium]